MLMGSMSGIEIGGWVLWCVFDLLNESESEVAGRMSREGEQSLESRVELGLGLALRGFSLFSIFSSVSGFQGCRVAGFQGFKAQAQTLKH